MAPTMAPKMLWASGFLLTSTLAFASFIGPVVPVPDGDTIEVLHNTHPERVRLSGLDCSEKRLGLVTLCAGGPLPNLTAVWVLFSPS